MDEQNLAEIIQTAVETQRGLVTYPNQTVYCSMREPVQLDVYLDGRVFRVHIEAE